MASSGPSSSSALMTATNQKHVESHPPGGKKKVTGIWWDPDTEEIVLIIKD